MKLCWWLVDKLSRMLEPNERDAVRGDFAELGFTGSQALRDLLGLIARRQAALWKDWHPWLALLGIALPVGLLLTRSSVYFSGSLSRHLWTWWRYGVRYETGLTLAGDVSVFVCGALALLFSSWVSGFALGSLSRRTLWVNAVLFYFSWLLPIVVFLPAVLLTSHRIAPFLLTFSVLPSACLFVLPSALGMRDGLRRGPLTLRPTILLVAMIITIDALAIWTGAWWRDGLIIWSQGTWHGPAYDWQRPLLILALTNWPLVYLIATAIHRHRECMPLTAR